jgi:DNA-directed RNA polymerase subunit RPC12/RpoP
METNIKKRHMYTSETIFHFTCGECKNWWSYAGSHTWHEDVTCPHCGLKNKVELYDVRNTETWEV